VDAQLGVDHVVEGFLDVINSRGHEVLPSRGEAVAWDIPAAGSSMFSRACDVASFQAIHESNAHFTRAGYFDTPVNATASSRTSSSGVTRPLLCINATNSRCATRPVSMSRPMTRSVRTEALAWLIEQPALSYDTSVTVSPSSLTRNVISSPHVGLTWCTSTS